MPSKPIRTGKLIKEAVRRVKQHNELTGLLFDFMIRTGLRYSDATALKFSQIYLDADKKIIVDSISIVQSKPSKARITHIENTKGTCSPTERARARSDSRVEVHFNKQLKAVISRIKAINGEHELLFQSNNRQAKKGKPISSQFMNKLLKKVGLEMGLGISLSSHSCRKTFAMFLMDKGASLAVVRDALGHSSTAITDHYVSTCQDEVGKFTKSIKF